MRVVISRHKGLRIRRQLLLRIPHCWAVDAPCPVGTGCHWRIITRLLTLDCTVPILSRLSLPRLRNKGELQLSCLPSLPSLPGRSGGHLHWRYQGRFWARGDAILLGDCWLCSFHRGLNRLVDWATTGPWRQQLQLSTRTRSATCSTTTPLQPPLSGTSVGTWGGWCLVRDGRYGYLQMTWSNLSERTAGRQTSPRFAGGPPSGRHRRGSRGSPSTASGPCQGPLAWRHGPFKRRSKLLPFTAV